MAGQLKIFFGNSSRQSWIGIDKHRLPQMHCPFTHFLGGIQNWNFGTHFVPFQY